MKSDFLKNFINYLEPMQMYAKVLEFCDYDDDLDDFDRSYYDLFRAFEDFIRSQMRDKQSPLNTLMNEYGELIVDYPKSMLFACLQALERGYEKNRVYNEGKKAVYTRFYQEVHGVDVKEALDSMTLEEFEEFERTVISDDFKKSSN